MKQFLFIVALMLMSPCYLAIAKSGKATAAAHTEEVTNAPMPSLKQLVAFYHDLEMGKSTAIKEYGFVLVDNKEMTVQEEYDEEGPVEITLYKDIYHLKYNVTKEMTLEYVHKGVDTGDGTLTLFCDKESWDIYFQDAEKKLREMGNSLFLSDAGFVVFGVNQGIIRMCNDCSVSWPEDDDVNLSISDLISIYNKNDKAFAALAFRVKGYTAINDEWKKDKYTIMFDGNSIKVEAHSEDGNTPFPDGWYNEIDKLGYIYEDSSVGMVHRTDYTKRGLPMISIGCVMDLFVLCVGHQANM